METSLSKWIRKWELAAALVAISRTRMSDNQRLTCKTVNLRTEDISGYQ